MAVVALVNRQIPTYAFGLKKGRVSKIEINTKLNLYTDIHTIILYINSQRQEQYYDYILSLNPQRTI